MDEVPMNEAISDALQGTKKTIDDLQVSLKQHAAHLGRCFEQSRRAAEEFSVRLSRVENDLAVIKDYLVTKMREGEASATKPA